jgi:hypothetical protein
MCRQSGENWDWYSEYFEEIRGSAGRPDSRG